MATAENEYYLRSILLLNEGGLYISKQVLAREVNKHGGDFDTLLKRFETKLRHQLHRRQYEKLFPVPTNVDKWDLQMVILVTQTLFRKSLNLEQRQKLQILLVNRHNLAHGGSASLDREEYDDVKEQLKDALNCLADSFPERDVKNKCAEFISKYETGALDVTSAIENIRRLNDNDAMFETVLNAIDGLKLNTHADIQNIELKLSALEQRLMTKLNGMTQEAYQKQIKVGVHTELRLSGPSQEWINLMEKTLNDIFNEADKTAGGDFREIEKTVEHFLGIIRDKANFKGSSLKCVVLMFECTSYANLQWLLRYFRSQAYQQELEKMATALKTYFSVDDQVDISSNLSLDCVQAILEELEKDSDVGGEREELPFGACSEPQAAAEKSKALQLAFECTSLEGLHHVWNLFQKGGATDHLNKIADALSEHFGERVSLKAHLDIDEFKGAVEESVGYKVFDSTPGEPEIVAEDQVREARKDSTESTDFRNVRPEAESVLSPNYSSNVFALDEKDLTLVKSLPLPVSTIDLPSYITRSNENEGQEVDLADKRLIAQLRRQLEERDRKMGHYEDILKSVKVFVETEINSIRECLKQFKEAHVKNSQSVEHDLKDVSKHILQALLSYDQSLLERTQTAKEESETEKDVHIGQTSEYMPPVASHVSDDKTPTVSYLDTLLEKSSKRTDVQYHTEHELIIRELLDETESLTKKHKHQLEIKCQEAVDKVTKEKDSIIDGLENRKRELTNEVKNLKEETYVYQAKDEYMTKRTMTLEREKESTVRSLKTKLDLARTQLIKYQEQELLNMGSDSADVEVITPEEARTSDPVKESHLVSDPLKQTDTQMRIETLEAVVRAKDEEIDRMKKQLTKPSMPVGKEASVDKISVTSCHIGDLVLLCLDDQRSHYLVFCVGPTMHFLHPDSFAELGLQTGPTEPRKSWVLAVIVDKEYCMAKKPNNRFHVPVGTRFYRVKAKPWVRESVQASGVTSVTKDVKDTAVSKLGESTS